MILLEDQRLQWETEFGGKTKQWYATITELTPDQRIAWESEDGEYVAGIVTFETIGTSRTRLNLKLFYDTKGSRRAEDKFLSSAGDRVEQDLEKFRKFIEAQDSVQQCNWGDSGMKSKGGISKLISRNVLHRPNPGPSPIPEPDPPQPPPHPIPTPPIPPEPPVSGT